MAEAWERQHERGAPAGIRFLLWVTLRLGRPVARFVLFFPATYFTLTGSAARRASRDFLRRALGREPTWLDVWKHFWAFATVSLDRVYWLSGRNAHLEARSFRPEDAVRAQDRGGCLTLVAHLGTFDVRRSTTNQRRHAPMRIVMNRAHGAMFVKMLEELNPSMADMVIDAAQRGPTLALAIREALDAGHLVGMMADRVGADDRAVTVDFMGGKAQLPASPWIIAGVMQVPVVIAFGLYRGGNRYEAHIELLAERVDLPRANREQAIQAYAQRYADRLAHYARMAPYNWFNFYDFWTHEPATN